MSQKDCTAERGSWWQNAQVSIRLRKGLSGRPPKPRRVLQNPLRSSGAYALLFFVNSASENNDNM